MKLAKLVCARSAAAARRELAAAFRFAGIERPDLDARVLVGHALGLDHAALVAAADRRLDEVERRRIADFAARRLAGEPVARIVESREFWSLPIGITAAVFVPRPDTEIVVETALAALRNAACRQPLRIADLCCGSGALLLALLSELPGAFGVGTDRSIAALAVARRNAQRLGLAARTVFVGCDFGAALQGGLDLVTANPPYVETGAIATLAPEVRDHEPPLALDGGADGLSAYRTIAGDTHRLLGPDGRLVIELGAGQQCAVEGIFTAAGLTVLAAAADLAGIPRALSVCRKGGEGRQ